MDIDLVRIVVEDSGFDFVVPVEFFGYRVVDEVEHVPTDAGRTLIRFGTIGRPGPLGVGVSVFVDEETGEVVSGMEPDDVAPVNTSPALFTDCVRRLADIFPFYAEGSDPEDWEAGAQKVEEAIREIDSAAYQEGAFWYEFRWDVTMGDFHAA
ncbi:SUKH-4 family immunity protein [Streptomyces sp. NPDC048002]|uniref:SUKH-4 family immunity protein n=1 Tax=Streptomyces sp. NPDC048002 TaxID=3154344 RepID=UPI0033DFCC1D